MKTCVKLWLYFAEFFLEWEMLQIKVVDKIKTHTVRSITFFLWKKKRAFYGNVEKYRRAGQATDDRTHAHCMLDK